MTFLWDSFVSKLRSAGTSVDAIQYCSENVLIELIQDLGLTPSKWLKFKLNGNSV